MNLRTIAQHFDVSINTVSRALRDQSGVSDELRTKIKAYAEENHYIPNSFGSGLRGKKTNLIGIVIADSFNPAYFDEVRYIQSMANDLGLNILLTNSYENIDIENSNIKLMIEKRVDGLLIVPCGYEPASPPNDYSLLAEFNIPFVLMHRYIEGKDYDCVKFDNDMTGHMAVDYLINNGHSKILHLLPTSTNSSVRDRIEGYKRAYWEHGLEMDDKLVLRCNISEVEDARAKVLEALQSGLEFTAVCTYNDLMAFGAMKALYQKRIKIPEQIAVLGADNIQNSDISLVPLTTIHLSGAELGTKALKILVDKMKHRSLHSAVVENVLPSLIERESV